MRIGVLLIILLAAAIISPSVVGLSSVSGYSIVVVYADGGVLVEYRLSIADIPSNVTLRVPVGALMVYVEAGGEPTPYTYDEDGGLLSFIALYDNVVVRVYTQKLTSKGDGLWTLNMGLVDFETLLLLPRDFILVSVEPRDFTFRIINGTPYIVFKPGSNVKVEYMFMPTTITPVPPITPTEITTPVTPTTPKEYLEKTTPVVEERPGFPPLLIIIVLVAVILAALALYRLRWAKAGFIPETMVEELDARDKTIIDIIASKGEATASVIQRETGIPKTPLYRKLEKLEKLGYIESELRGGVKVYRIKKR